MKAYRRMEVSLNTWYMSSVICKSLSKEGLCTVIFSELTTKNILLYFQAEDSGLEFS
jgi:hypothetical protein